MRVSIIVAVLVAWISLLAFTAGSVYWRDSGEFILAAFFLDTSHPAGFPLYAQLANLIALIPIGPIAWRVNVFSALCGLACLLLSAALAWRMAQRHNLRGWYVGLVTLSPWPLLLSMESFWRQSITAEVYSLHAALLLLQLLLLDVWREHRDVRWVWSAAFAAGLTLGNHAAAALPLGMIFIVVAFVSRFQVRLLLGALLSGLVGIAIYSYLPVRALSEPPLNTGQVNSWARFWSQISDQRDRVLRAPSSPNQIGEQLNFSILGDRSAGMLQRLVRDVERVSAETGTLSLLLVVCGLLMLLLHDMVLAIGLIAIVTGSWIFFSGWQLDPWIAAVSAGGVAISAALAVMLKRSAKSAPVLALGFIVLCGVDLSLPSMAQLRLAANDQRAAEVTRAELVHVPAGALYLSEPGWFLAKYMRDIEGYRDDVVIAHLPSVMFPDYFRPLKLRIGSAELFDLSQQERLTEGGPSAEYARLGLLLSSATRYVALSFEPVAAMNVFVRDVVRLAPGPLATLERGQKRNVPTEHVAQVFSRIRSDFHQLSHLSDLSRADARDYLEQRAAGWADLFDQLSEHEYAAEVLTSLCAFQPGDFPACNPITLNNLVVYLLRAGKPEEAVSWAEIGLKSGRGNLAVLRENLRLATARISG